MGDRPDAPAQPAYDPKRIEAEVQRFWAAEGIPRRITALDPKKKKFYLLDGPPYVNDKPHVGHVKTTTLKDVWGRFKYMQGHAVWFQPGFDCGGLPIENKVEKQLGLQSKQDIEKLGVDRFIRECAAFATGNQQTWLSFYKTLGAWRGWVPPYLTSSPEYLESGWWAVKQWHDKGLLTEGVKPGFWCPHCETVLAGYEVSDSYKNVEDPSLFATFRLRGRDEFLLVWTTTPWTLPGNVVIAVHPDEAYVRANVGGRILILAEKRLAAIADRKPEVLARFPGTELEGLRYEPLLDVPLQRELDRNENAHRVVVSVPLLKTRVASKIAAKRELTTESRGPKTEDFGHIVDMDTGSGLVHIATGHGFEDNRLGKHYNLPEPSPVDEQGKLTKDAGAFAGLRVKQANAAIIATLKETGRLFSAGTITHAYPLCWRCKTPLLYRMSRQWFLKLDTLRDALRAEAQKTNWLPLFAKERFRNLLADAPDWAVTRQRYWGIPLPVWECASCRSRTVIGSRQELQQKAGLPEPPADIHKNTADRISLPCACGSEMQRVPDVLDVWFDSGIAPWASLHYPFENKQLFERLFPADLIDESQDQVRGWFYTLLLCGVATFGRRPYETVCLNGWMLDEQGQKMSKSLGNVVSGADAVQRLGADALRLYYCSDIAPWETQKFSERNAREVGRALAILWNAAAFAKTYAVPPAAQASARPAALAIEDRWLLSRTRTLTKTVTESLESFAFHTAGRALLDFILNDLSRFYIKAVRDRMAPDAEPAGRAAASHALLAALETVSRLLAPFAPFLSEHVWQGLGSPNAANQSAALLPRSVHEQPWPKPGRPNRALEARLAVARQVVDAIAAERQARGLKLRHPLSHAIVGAKSEELRRAIEAAAAVIAVLGNVKEVRIAKSPKEGPFLFGSLLLGEVLPDEATLREVIRFVQGLRKQAGLRVGDRIRVTLSCPPAVQQALERHAAALRSGVGARAVAYGPLPDGPALALPEGGVRARVEKL